MAMLSNETEQSFQMRHPHDYSEGLQLDSDDFAEYRLTPSHFYLGAISTTFFILMGTFSVLAAVFNIDGSFPHPLLFALFTGSIWFGFASLGLYIIAAYFREKLVLTETGVFQQSVIVQKEAQIAEITEITWPGTSLRITTDRTLLRIYLANFSQEEQAEIIDYFRVSVPEERQEGWEAFQVQNELRVVTRSMRKQAWDGYVLYAVTFYTFAGLSVYLWTFDVGGYLLGIAVICAVLGIASAIWAIKIWRRPQEDPEAENGPSQS